MEETEDPPPTRSLRRHHNERLKSKRKDYHGWNGDSTPRIRGIYLNTPAPCSCWMCGNERKYFGNRTRKEILQLEIFKKEMSDV